MVEGYFLSLRRINVATENDPKYVLNSYVECTTFYGVRVSVFMCSGGLDDPANGLLRFGPWIDLGVYAGIFVSACSRTHNLYNLLMFGQEIVSKIQS